MKRMKNLGLHNIHIKVCYKLVNYKYVKVKDYTIFKNPAKTNRENYRDRISA